MKVLNGAELLLIQGGWFNFIASGLIGYAMYAGRKDWNGEPKTLSGAATAASFGAVTGGLNSVVVEAAGGGALATALWYPGFASINAAGQSIAAGQK